MLRCIRGRMSGFAVEANDFINHGVGTFHVGTKHVERVAARRGHCSNDGVSINKQFASVKIKCLATPLYLDFMGPFWYAP